MTQGAFIADRATLRAVRDNGGFATLWHGAWLVVVALAAAIVALATADGQTTVLALTAAATPGAAGLLLARRGADAVQLGLLALWTAATAAAVTLTGGFSESDRRLAAHAARRRHPGRRGAKVRRRDGPDDRRRRLYCFG